MPAVSQFLIKSLLSQFNRCEKAETKGRGVSDDRNLVAVVSLVVALLAALLALLLAIMSYRRSRFNGPASSLPSSPFIKACSPTHLFIANHTNIFSASQSIKAST